MTHIPTGITRLKSLVALDMSGTRISFLPQNLWRCSELRHVRLNGTNVVLGMMHSWDPLVKLPRLETLELRWVSWFYLFLKVNFSETFIIPLHSRGPQIPHAIHFLLGPSWARVQL